MSYWNFCFFFIAKLKLSAANKLRGLITVAISYTLDNRSLLHLISNSEINIIVSQFEASEAVTRLNVFVQLAPRQIKVQAILDLGPIS